MANPPKQQGYGGMSVHVAVNTQLYNPKQIWPFSFTPSVHPLAAYPLAAMRITGLSSFMSGLLEQRQKAPWSLQLLTLL